MIVHEFVINNKSGLHARPAALWVQTAGRYQSSIRLKKDNREVDGKSLLAVLSLGLTAGSSVQVTLDGPDETAADNELMKLIAELAAAGEQAGHE
ncbi:HPr family phosphocarrier protein [Sporomusa termitida]|uniref:Phosphocarrier protein HPr n=1 Tax=Sporomusa termitida TaxID=2377 RepID=A0A517DYW7_9FIRM|nr:HPr family phosphocarrier protein [Sporomusa termitida]QDR82554.1 phosphocarrier, HPr family [Sporomusa termitida]